MHDKIRSCRDSAPRSLDAKATALPRGQKGGNLEVAKVQR